MNNVQLNIVANAQFQQVYAEVAKLKEAMLSLQKASVGGPFTSANVAGIKQAQTAFDNAVLSTRAFNIESVAMSSSIEKFGKQLSAGKLSLSQYYKIWRDSAKGTSKELDALATSQARLNRSIAIADPLRPGYAKLVTDINGVVTAQEKQMFYQKALNTALNEGSIKLINFGKNTQWMGRQLTVGLTMPLAMFGAGISSAFLTVDKELTRMQKVYGSGLIQPTQQALKQVREDVQALGTDLAKTMGASVKDTAAMAANLAATGLQGAELLSSTREAMRLATLGELDHQEAMMATVSLQNVYKLSTQGLSEAVNFLNAVENQTSTSLQDLVDAIPRVGPIVKQLGGSFKDTAAMMVAMKEAGVPAAQGANAIKSALASLINPTKAAKEAFAGYNINIGNMAKVTKGSPILMLKTLANEMKNLDQVAKAQLIEKMFGKYQFARVSALLDNINKAGTQTATVFDLMGASTTDLATLSSNELKTITESASGKFKRMVEGLKADLLPMGNAFLESFTRIGTAVNKILNAFQSLGQVLGPVSKILGPLLGTGLAGLIVVGPIIMLIGLFSNLIGNILRSANSIRMFKQGMDAALPSENKFMAGLHGMRNFYETLDKSTIAARNQMDLMPEAITSNARAFDILSSSINNLTMQFQALTVAQADAMGLGVMGQPGKTGKVGPSPFTVPFRAPGHIDGAVGLTGGIPGQDSIPAMLAPGESVMTAAATAKYGSVFPAMNAGTLPGFATGRIGSGASGRVGKSGATVVRPYLSNVSNTGGLENFNDINPNDLADLSSLYAKEISAKAQISLNAINKEISIWQQANSQQISAAAEAVNSGISSQEAYSILMEKFATDMQSTNGPFQGFVTTAKAMAPELKADLIEAQAAAQRMNLNLHNAADAAALAAELPNNMIANSLSTPGSYLPASKARQGAAAVMGGSSGIGKYGVPRMMIPPDLHPSNPLYKMATSQEHISTTMLQQQNAKILREARAGSEKMLQTSAVGMQQGIKIAAQMNSPAKTEIMMGETLVDSLNTGINSRKGQSIVAGERMGDAVNNGFKSRISRITNSFSNMGYMAKSTIGMGAMIGGSSLGNAIGGPAGSAISGAASFGSMALMMGAGGPVVGGLVALGAAIPLVTSAFKTLADNARMNASQIKSAFTMDAIAAQQFGIKFQSIANYDFSSFTSSLDKHVTSVKNNKAAVDALTQAYMNSTDQFVKDDLKKIKSMQGAELLEKMNKTYATTIAAGGTKDQAMQTVVSKMLAAGKTAGDISFVKSKITTPGNVNDAFNKILQYALKGSTQNDPMAEARRASIEGSIKSGEADLKNPNLDAKTKSNIQKQIEDLKSRLSNIDGKNVVLSSDTLKGLGENMVQLTQGPLKNFDTAVSQLTKTGSGLGKSINGNKELFGTLSSQMAVNWKDFDKVGEQYRKTGGTVSGLSKAIALLNSGLVEQKLVYDALASGKIDEFYKTQLPALLKAQKALGIGIPGLGDADGGVTDYSKQYSPLLKHLNSVQKLIQAQTDAQKKYNDQLKATQDYQIKQMDFYNQMKNAFTSGNFLGAALLQNSAKASQADFAGSVKEQKNQNLLSNIQNIIATVQEASTGGGSFAKFKKSNPELAKFTSSKYDSSLLGGVSPSSWSKNTSNIVSKATTAQNRAGTVAGGDSPFSSLTINISADNSIIPEQFSANMSQQIVAAIQKAYAKSQTSNKVTPKNTTKGTVKK